MGITKTEKTRHNIRLIWKLQQSICLQRIIKEFIYITLVLLYFKTWQIQHKHMWCISDIVCMHLPRYSWYVSVVPVGVASCGSLSSVSCNITCISMQYVHMSTHSITEPRLLNTPLRNVLRNLSILSKHKFSVNTIK